MRDVHGGDAPGLKTIATIARWLLVLYLLANATWLLMTALIRTMASAPTLLAGIIGLAAISGALLWFASGIVAAAWVYLAHQNLRAAKLPELRFSPAWAVASFFVPFVNLVVPFQAMRELYNRSHREPPHEALASAPDVSSWWSCTIVGGLIYLIFMTMVAIMVVTNIRFTAPPAANLILGLFGTLLLMGSAFFLHRIIGAITRAQLRGVGVEQAFA